MLWFFFIRNGLVYLGFESHLKGRIVQPPKTGLKCTSAAAPTLQQTVACTILPFKALSPRSTLVHMDKSTWKQTQHIYVYTSKHPIIFHLQPKPLERQQEHWTSTVSHLTLSVPSKYCALIFSFCPVSVVNIALWSFLLVAQCPPAAFCCCY